MADKTDKSSISIDTANRKRHTWIKVGKEIEKDTKNDLKLWLKCRDLKLKSSESKSELLSKYNSLSLYCYVRHNVLNLAFSVVIL